MRQTLKNNKSRADILLAAIFILFAAATLSKHFFKDSFFAGLLAFTLEAALVGGIADWFAVTALFKKPLGFSWHTAIIPNNRDKIVKSITDLVSNELLSTEAIIAKLTSTSLMDTMSDGLLDTIYHTLLGSKFEDILGNRTTGLDMSKLAGTLDQFIRQELRKESISSEIRSFLLQSFEDGKHEIWLSKLIEKFKEIIKKDTTRERIYKILREQERNNETNTGAGSFFVRIILNVSRGSKHNNLFSIAEVLQVELLDVLDEIGNPAGPLFSDLAEKSSDLLKHLDADQNLLDLLQTLKNGMLEHLDLLEVLQQLLHSAAESENRRREAAQWLADNVEHYRARLKNDEKIKASTEEMLKTIIQKIIIREHHLIGEITEETLNSFSNGRLADFINDKVGDDLQWIRVNGCIIGAVAGIIIYLFTHLLYSPYILPLLQNSIR